MSSAGDETPSPVRGQTHVSDAPVEARASVSAAEALPLAARPGQRGLGRALALLATPELMVSLLLVVVFTVAAAQLPNFLSADYLLDRSTVYMEAGVMALAMTFVIAGGHIDLSPASMLALTAALVTTLNVKLGLPMLPLVLLAPLIGGALGAVNGLLVARMGLPSLVVTLATMAAYRGLAQALVGDASLDVPEWFRGFDDVLIAGTPIPMPLVVFVGLGIVLGIVLHKTLFGRYVLAIGTNGEAALYSGVPVARVTAGVFVLSGVASAVAAMMMVSRYGQARWDQATAPGESELDVITAVVLGGASIFGGRASIFGTVVALLLIGVLQTAIGLAGREGEYQLAANGALLIFAVLASNAATYVQGRRGI